MQGNQSNSNRSWEIRQSIPSDTKLSSQIIQETLAELRSHGWTENDVFGVHMAMEEALMNAIKHGNAGDSSKRVNVEISLENDEVMIRVTDEGQGFDPEDVPDPTTDENLEKDNGRGLLLMRSFMSSVEFSDKGNSVYMTKQKGVPPGSV